MLRVDALTKRFGGLTAVDSVTFDVKMGETLGLIGPNGAGKTTIFSLITGALRPDAGKVFLDSRDVTNASPEGMCDNGVARTFQIPRPFRNLTVLQNIVVGGLARGRPMREATTRAIQALDLVGLGARSESSADVLPLGQLKRLEVARCIATDARVLLLDEITSGLNPVEVSEMETVIATVTEAGISTVVIDHNMTVVSRICSRIVVLNYGRVIAEGTHSEIASDPAVIKAYLGGGTPDA